jgi:hypothetical protein
MSLHSKENTPDLTQHGVERATSLREIAKLQQS